MAEDSSDGEAHDDDTSHAAPAKKTLEELMAQKEGEDEAMQRYKMTLLKQDSFEKTDDPRHVVLMEMRILIEDRDPLVFDLVSPKKDTVFVLKEGCKYRIQVRAARVQSASKRGETPTHHPDAAHAALVQGSERDCLGPQVQARRQARNDEGRHTLRDAGQLRAEQAPGAL